MLMYQLFRPFAYLRIKDPDKWKIDALVPLIAAILTTAVYIISNYRIPISSTDGVVRQAFGILQVLPGFYVTALAAVATFDRKDLDDYMPSPPPEVWIKSKGHPVLIKLTRRRFLCLLYGYLSAVSLTLFIVSAFVISSTPWLGTVLSPSNLIKALFMFLYSFAFWNMIAVTLFGLYQLSDRIHQPD